MPSPELLARMEQIRTAFAVVPSLEQRRQGSVAGTAVPPGVRIDADRAGTVPAEWLCADGIEATGVVLYFHGGGYVAGSPAIARALVADVSRLASVRVLSPAYRLAPEHPFPAAVHDAMEAYRWLLDGGTAPEAIVVGGTSAGGGLAIALLVAAREAGLPLPAAAFAICPWTDMTLRSASMLAEDSADPIPPDEIHASVRHYLAGQDPRAPLASPLFADHAGLPPVHLEVGTADRLLDDSRTFAGQAAAEGVRVTLEVTEGAMHSFPHFAAGTPEAVAAIDRVARHIRSALSPH